MSISNSSFYSLFNKKHFYSRALLVALFCLLSLQSPWLNAGTPKEEPVVKQQLVNVNSASAQELADALDGVGLAKAKAIVEHRKRYGQFKHIDSLESVKGIGTGTLEKNRSKILLK